MISKIRVQNFRKHKDLTVKFKPGNVIVTGVNGSGKTSIAEAIYIALRGKSWRSNFSEIITNNEIGGWWRIDIEFFNGNKRTVKFINNKKIFEIDDQTYYRLPNKLKIPVILFEPSDLQLLYGSPSRRRDFFDRFITQIDHNHATNLKKFERVLSQRNNLLKNGYNREGLFVWDIQFADLAEKIISSRISWIKKIDQQITKHYREIADNEDEVSVSYSSGFKNRNQILKQLEEELSDNSYFTKTGPQTHDIKIKINNKNAKTTASRGENRTIVFAILYSMIEISNLEAKDTAILMFDDIDSELDDNRKRNLYNSDILKNNYLFATTTKTEHKPINHLHIG